ncbi:MAG: hypothetical protein JWO08_1121 [Verrucomicrobiaceae bacterium]|nr:hypothetical protein [Verrucomicrobiaceae bacterium]
MPLPAHSPEFARLATRWLEGTATAAEAKLLFESVQADKACAKEFADQARFELLLQDTLRERLREQGIAAGAREKAATYHRRATVRRALAVAAMIAFTGYLLWLVLPSDHSQPVPETVQVPQVMPFPRSHPMPGNTMVLMAREDPAKPAADTPPDPLQKQLDQFFLTGIDLDKVPLSRALKQLEDQLRELNFANKAELAALHVQLPPGAGAQPVTFHSGSISFLKAVRALAALAGYDVNADDTSVSLLARGNGNPMQQESRTLDTLLTKLGATSDPNRNRLRELFNDARSLGLQLDSSLDANGNILGLQATPGQFEALALMAESRDQIRSMPPMRFYMRASRSQPGTQNHIFTGSEAERERAQFEMATGPDRPAPVIVPILEFVPTDIFPPGTIMVVATPVGGDKIYLRVSPSFKNDPPTPEQRLATTPSAGKDATVAVVGATFQGKGEVLTLNVGATIENLADVRLATAGIGGNTVNAGGLNFLSNSQTLSSGSTFNIDMPTGSTAMNADAAIQALSKLGPSSDTTLGTWTVRILTVNGTTMVTGNNRADLVTKLEFYREP